MESTQKYIENIQKNLDHWLTPEVFKDCLGFIDLTSLKPNDTQASIIKMTNKVNNFNEKFPEYSTPASICVFPNFSKTVKDNLTAPGVNITVVSGCFPASQSYLDVKLLESKLAVENGANEVDIVLPLNKFLAEDYEGCKEEIIEIKKVIDRKSVV